MTIKELSQRFGIGGAVEFRSGPGGLTEIAVAAAGATAAIMPHGGHVTAYRPAGQRPLLWLSRQSWFHDGKPIRGGVPVCFPWFGANGPTVESPLHGFARLTDWDVESVRKEDSGEVTVAMSLAADDGTRAQWPHDFHIRHVVTVGRQLKMCLEVVNPGTRPITVTEALHSYFAVSDARNVTVLGLEGAEYLDKTADGGRRRQTGPITFTAETDRLFVNTMADCLLEDGGWGRRIVVTKSGSSSTLVWNPWGDKARRMPDYGNDEWARMVCIETANAADNAVTIPPGGSHSMQARIAAEALGERKAESP